MIDITITIVDAPLLLPFHAANLGNVEGLPDFKTTAETASDMTRQKKTYRQNEEILDAMFLALKCRCIWPVPPQNNWPSTRELADDMDISIYKARYLLMKLETCGKVISTKKSIMKSIRWYLTAIEDEKTKSK